MKAEDVSMLGMFMPMTEMEYCLVLSTCSSPLSRMSTLFCAPILQVANLNPVIEQVAASVYKLFSPF